MVGSVGTAVGSPPRIGTAASTGTTSGSSPGHGSHHAPTSLLLASAVSVPRLRVVGMALHLHRAERTDLLADGLGTLLSAPLPDPFGEELVLVPAQGVERWLSQRLSNRLGVCAAVQFRNPRSLIAEITGTQDDDPWSPDAMVWPLL